MELLLFTIELNFLNLILFIISMWGLRRSSSEYDMCMNVGMPVLKHTCGQRTAMEPVLSSRGV